MMPRALIVGLVVAIGAGVFWVLTRPDEDPPVDQPSSPRIIALGDSYISGEGASSFAPDTNVVGGNQCRRAATSYPYLVADALGQSVLSVACSGAKVEDVLAPTVPKKGDGQYPESPAGVLGAEKQIEVLESYPEPDVILISIGGNDIKFSQIVRDCISPGSCLGRVPEYFARVDNVEADLREAYAAVRDAAPDAEIYAIDYPMPLSRDRECFGAFLSHEEFEFVDEFVHRFDDVIRFAGQPSNVIPVDIEEAFEGHRICDDVTDSEQAMNSLTVDRPRFSLDHPTAVLTELAAEFHNSYHPTPYGHRLIAEEVLKQMVDDGTDPPDVDDVGVPPNAQPWVPEEYGPPMGPYPFPTGTDCSGGSVAAHQPVQLPATTPTVKVPVATLPGVTVCFRAYKQRWSSDQADSEGHLDLVVDFKARHGVPSIHEILVQDTNGEWTTVIVSRA